MKRRDFIKSSAITGGSLALGQKPSDRPGIKSSSPIETVAPLPSPKRGLPDLEPARWIWYPSGRCLPNTFVLFRRELILYAKPIRAGGWIAAESRYRLEVNGRRVQWGPAPADPRWPEADPVDLTELLQPGRNIIGATVLYYGHGDGTWPLGKPGFLFWLETESANGSPVKIVSDGSWKAHLARAWRPGQYKRWYLRALQEEFDARLYPDGWTLPSFKEDSQWVEAMELEGSPNRPALSTSYYEYVNDLLESPAETELRPRSIPLLSETPVPAARLAESFWIDWRRPPQEYFECRPPDSFEAVRRPSAVETGPGQWEVALDGKRGAALTFELEEQVVGWPYFTIEAPAGTTVELLVHEAHAADGPPLLNTHFDSWSRFVCRQGINTFEGFDFESLRWLQLHIHDVRGRVKVRDVGVRRRTFPWPNAPDLRVSEPPLQRLIAASINTLNNCAQETLVDGMARERQQYSGDCGHQTHAIYLAFGETRQPARYLTTFSQGQTLEGYFLDCWPAYDRLARLVERQLELTRWGPLLDHGVGFNFDCWHHYLYTGDLEALREPYPRLIRFAQYLHGIRGRDGLLPVENIGTPAVWIDHNAYERQRHKQCAFNLYAAAMFENALVPLCRAFGDRKQEKAARNFGRDLLAAAAGKFWSPEREIFVNNLPWLKEEGKIRLCDRSLATAVLFDQFPGKNAGPSLRALAECPPEMGFSYPANAGWRLWALAKGGRADIILQDLRERWATMDSVLLNNTLQEDWEAKPDSGQQWSHCAVVPIYIAYMGLAGIRPLEPGFSRVEIRPQPAGLSQLELVARTVRGPLVFRSLGNRGNRELTLELPKGCEGEIVLPERETIDLILLKEKAPLGHSRWAIPAGASVTLKLKHT
ncbi:MAG TPA: alpha-L-rhamnosidase N-terminal domain-containing protein [Candidatus Desulfaltia sp.]|nr:alpha-L-rhamnosidase N-terminal domain-containing protein [Candidatus Desulfaltia sp.]